MAPGAGGTRVILSPPEGPVLGTCLIGGVRQTTPGAGVALLTGPKACWTVDWLEGPASGGGVPPQRSKGVWLHEER